MGHSSSAPHECRALWKGVRDDSDHDEDPSEIHEQVLSAPPRRASLLQGGLESAASERTHTPQFVCVVKGRVSASGRATEAFVVSVVSCGGSPQRSNRVQSREQECRR